MKIHVEKYRLERGLSLNELYRLSGVAASHIGYIESGRSIPTLTTLCKLSKALDVPAYKLFSCDE